MHHVERVSAISAAARRLWHFHRMTSMIRLAPCSGGRAASTVQHPVHGLQPTAACLIIGDEILTGKVHDSNSHFLAKQLYQCGIRLGRIEVVPDDIPEIVDALRRLAPNHRWVFTSGGIGERCSLLGLLQIELTYVGAVLNSTWRAWLTGCLLLCQQARHMTMSPTRPSLSPPTASSLDTHRQSPQCERRRPGKDSRPR